MEKTELFQMEWENQGCSAALANGWGSWRSSFSKGGVWLYSGEKTAPTAFPPHKHTQPLAHSLAHKHTRPWARRTALHEHTHHISLEVRQKSKDLTRQVKGIRRLEAAERRGRGEGAEDEGWREGKYSSGIERVTPDEMKREGEAEIGGGRGGGVGGEMRNNERGEKASGELELWGMNKCGRSGKGTSTKCKKRERKEREWSCIRRYWERLRTGLGSRKRDVFCVRPGWERNRQGDKLSREASESRATEEGACMHLDVSSACAESPSEAKISGERRLKEGGERQRGTKWAREMVAVIRWCYLGAGRCVWHNLKLEIAVSISPHSVATRSTDNKSSLILLKISRECSGGWDEDGVRGRGDGGGGGWVADKRPNEGRGEGSLIGEANPKDNSEP